MSKAAATPSATLPAGIEIFRPGTHIDDQGRSHVFSDADVADMAASYNPATREAAAARAEAQRGRLGDGQGPTQYERNAFARCQVFKTDIDRHACAERVKQGAVSGSVESGGILRESTVQVPVNQ